MIQIDPALGWSIVVVLTGLVFAAGGAWVRLATVKELGVSFHELNRDVRHHMKEESEWRLEHVQHGGHQE